MLLRLHPQLNLRLEFKQYEIRITELLIIAFLLYVTRQLQPI